MSQPPLLWETLKNRLHPSEIEESLRVLGEEKIERNQSVANEIALLLELFIEIPDKSLYFSDYQKNIDIYLNQLSKKAKDLGVDLLNIVPLSTPRDKEVFDFLTSPCSSRPQTATTTDISISYSEQEILPAHIDIFFIEDHVKQFHEAFDQEYTFLLQRAKDIQEDLIKQTSTPTPNEIKKFSKKLETAVISDIHPEMFKRSKGVEIEETKKEESFKLEKGIELDFEIPIEESKPQSCKPRIRVIKKPSRPSTPVQVEVATKEPPQSRGKLARRLRGIVNDHKDCIL
ncbi:unnamed protein product [Blepharisma stoltei]|uniref:Uncharacterized protein n=1 Tax=Blepharisma stoltei TaxID=1481888 RepID=A0AAU9JKB0_9CILI|nr:unnamed protein product [Blepharisma stoltei]